MYRPFCTVAYYVRIQRRLGVFLTQTGIIWIVLPLLELQCGTEYIAVLSIDADQPCNVKMGYGQLIPLLIPYSAQPNALVKKALQAPMCGL